MDGVGDAPPRFMGATAECDITVGGGRLTVGVASNFELFIDVLTAAGYEVRDTDEDVMRVFVPDGKEQREIFRLAASHGVQVRHLRPSVPTLEDVFAHAVGEK